MERIRRLILENKAWAHGHNKIDPDYFANMAKEQNPEILWIGCADSRVPPDEIINTRPGSIFVHRNIANLVYADDENLTSVIEYAVKYLKVKYIIVCGHYNCGGVKAALDGIDNPILEKWTKSISDVKHAKNVTNLDQLVELNVCAQVEQLKEIPAIKETWEQGNTYPKIIGWVYNINNGFIKELIHFDPS